MNYCLSLQFGRTQAAPRLRQRGGWLPCQTSISAKLCRQCIRALIGSGLSGHLREARMSRSAFALKFRAVLGQTPLEYLTQWRMYKAGAMIRSNNPSFSEVASAVGYGSASSFSRVFSREMGEAPREYRRNCAHLQSFVEE